MKTLEAVAGPGRAFAMGPFGSNIKTENFVQSGVPVIQGRNLSGTRLDENDFVFLTDEKADELSASVVKSGDIVITHRGTLGQVVMIPRTSRYPRYVVSQSQMKISVDEDEMSPEFVTYWLQSSMGQAELFAYASQTGVPAIAQPLASLRKMRVICPPLDEQRAIAGVLGALDDKIESNRRMNGLVDGLVRSEFQRLAQTSTCESVSVGDVIDRVHKAVDPSALPPSTPYIGLEHMPRGSMFIDRWANADGLDSGKSQFEISDVLFGKLRPNFRKVGIAPISGIGSTDILVLRPRSGFSVALVLAIATSEEVLGPAIAASSGTKMPRVSWDYISKLQVSVPDASGCAEFADVIDPMIQRTMRALLENRILENTRDALLPELLSGRLRVRDAEKVVEGAV